MIITIDGPAGAGKSSVARGLADRLGFHFLDTGAMYRAVACAGIERNIDFQDSGALEQLARSLDIRWIEGRLLLDGRDVTDAIRSLEITGMTRHVADHPGVRAHLVQLQRATAVGRNVVTEGRDQGTVVFPDAQCKFYLTASPEERARRRQRDLEAQGDTRSFEEILAAQEERDTRDRTRSIAPLRQAADAIEVNTDGMSQDEVVDRLAEIVLELSRRYRP
ncbi:MAG: (d)CMP kinase [Pirellulales bacterium]|nr:(d)CMP kinase [Pirellulales bacterium]